MTIIKFVVGKTYGGKFITDSESVFKRTVVKRTDKMVWIADTQGKIKQRKIKLHRNVETCDPFGQYSMAPSLDADKVIA